MLPSHSASLILFLEEFCDIVDIPQVVKIAVIAAPLIKAGIQVLHHIREDTVS